MQRARRLLLLCDEGSLLNQNDLVIVHRNASGDDTISEYRNAIGRAISHAAAIPDEKLVLFSGAGLSRRHLLLPSWYELLEDVLDHIESKYPLDFFLQRSGNLIDAAKDISIAVHEWAWSEGKGDFPEELYSGNLSHVNFLKHIVAGKVSSATQQINESSGPALPEEIAALGNLEFENIVTTNYDQFWELLFGFSPTHGLDSTFRSSEAGVNVVKIHGCVTAPSSMVLLPEDYDNYSLRHKYIFSKLLVCFAEHPVLFVGYSLSDPDIIELIVETAKALRKTYLENVFVLSMGNEPEALIGQSARFNVLSGSGSADVNLIETSEFEWVYRAFSKTSRGAQQ